MRLKNYRYKDDYLLQNNRDKNEDFMNEVIKGTTLEHTDLGMFRASKYGYYTQLDHRHGLTNGKAGNVYTLH